MVCRKIKLQFKEKKNTLKIIINDAKYYMVITCDFNHYYQNCNHDDVVTKLILLKMYANLVQETIFIVIICTS